MRPLLLLLAMGCGGGPSQTTTSPTSSPLSPPTTEPTEFELTGTVIDADGAPVADAMVLFGGRPDTMVMTDTSGAFSIQFTPEEPGEPAIVAAKQGYRSVGDEFFDAGDVIELTLRRVSEVDNTEYTYQHPGDGQNTLLEDCTHCHTSFVADFVTSGHAGAARNPKLQDLYAGVSDGHDATSCAAAGGIWTSGHEPGTQSGSIDKCYLGGGVLPDLNPQCGGPCDTPGALAPATEFGACADCHAPGIDGVAGGRNLQEAHGLAYDLGVHCDTCHKVRDIDLSLPPGVGQRLVMGRPSEPGRNMFEWDPVYYGPLIDAPNVAMGGSYQPKFDLAVFCAGCHEQEQPALVPGTQLDARWTGGLPVHSTYSEWQQGPYNQEATQCQHCHMPADVELTNAVDLTSPDKTSITFGFPRDPQDIRRHLFRGPLEGSPRLIDSAVYVSLATSVEGDELVVDASLTNIGCGHAIPTGEPMRSLVMVVRAEGDCGELDALAGMTVPDIGGARTSGTLDVDLTVAGDQVQWPGHDAGVGDLLRVVRPTGVFDDYAAVGAFASSSPAEKGMEVFDPIGQVAVTAVAGDTLTTDVPLPGAAGDRVHVGEPFAPTDGGVSTHLAGLAGYAFAKVLTDPAGNRHVPHYKAVDIASDNRIGPGASARTTHRFDLPVGCSDVEARATLLYRPVPLSLAAERGWQAQDYIIATGTGSP